MQSPILRYRSPRSALILAVPLLVLLLVGGAALDASAIERVAFDMTGTGLGGGESHARPAHLIVSQGTTQVEAGESFEICIPIVVRGGSVPPVPTRPMVTPSPTETGIQSVTPTLTLTHTPTPRLPTATSTNAPVPTLTHTATPTPTPSANLVQNGSFETGLHHWELGTVRPAQAPVSLDDATSGDGSISAMIEVSVPATWLEAVQFVQDGISLVEGQTYRVVFWAKASVPRPVGIVLRMSSPPWTEYNDLLQDVTTSWTRYELSFAAGASSPNATLQFSLGQYASAVWLDGVELSSSHVGPTPTAGPTGTMPTLAPTAGPTLETPTLVFTLTPTPGQSGCVPYGPIVFGMFPQADYNSETLEAFSGGSLSLFSTGNPRELLNAAREKGLRMMVTIGDTDPCRYWNSSTFTFDYDLFMRDVSQDIPLVAEYLDVVVGISLLNEPHWINHPTSSCNTGIPPKYLYNLVKRVRTAFAEAGVTDPHFLIGVNVHPQYVDNSMGFPSYVEPPGGGQLTQAEKTDGTMNLLWLQYNPVRDGPVENMDNWARRDKSLAQMMGAKLIYSANAVTTGAQLPAANSWMCRQGDAAFVTYWMWGKQTVPLSSLVSVRQICEACGGN